jgi:hypothetical protein
MRTDETEGTLLPEEGAGSTTPEGTAKIRSIATARTPAKDLFRVGRRALDEWTTAMKARARKTTTGAALAGGIAVGSAVVFGIMETTLGVIASWYVYRRLRRVRPKLERT